MNKMPALADIKVDALDVKPNHMRPIGPTVPPKREHRTYHGASMGEHLGPAATLRMQVEARKLARMVELVLQRRDGYQQQAIERLRSTYDECPTLKRLASKG